jgi:succinate-acetate transporter protein
MRIHSNGPRDTAVAGSTTVPEQRGPLAAESQGGTRVSERNWDSAEAWTERSRLVLTPIAAPSILGLFGFAGATFMVASLLAGWWGNPIIDTPVIAPFALVFGGLAQLLAGMWAYRARDGLATAMHGTWGSFWLAWGMLVLGVQLRLLPPAVMTSQAFGFWFIVLSVVTLFGALAALAQSLALFTVLGLLAAGSILLAIGFVGGFAALVIAAGWVLVASAAAAFYTAGAMMLAESSKGHTILPLGKYSAAANIPGRRATEPIGYPGGMPGARVGQ